MGFDMVEVKDGEEKFKNSLLEGKIVHLMRKNGVIIELNVFDSAEEFISWYSKYQISEEFDVYVYMTAKEAYLVACNFRYFCYVSDFTESITTYVEGEDEDELTTQKKYRTLLNYDDFIKNIEEVEFVDGFYENDELLVPFIDGTTIIHEHDAIIDFEDIALVKGTFEIHFPEKK